MTPRHVLALASLPLLLASCATPTPTTTSSPTSVGTATAPAPSVTDGPSPSPIPEPSATAATTPERTAGQPSEPVQPSAPAPPPPAAATPTAQTDDPAQWEMWTLTTAGWGPVRPGQPLPASVRSSFKPGWECLGPRFIRDGQELVEVYTKDAKPGAPVTTISLLTSRTRTTSGVRIGDSEEKLRSTYPKIKPVQVPRGSGWMVHVWQLEDDTYSLFFEVDQRKLVKHISVQTYVDFHPMSQVGPCGAP